MNDGDDSLVVTGMYITTLDALLGGGADNLRMTLCDIGWLKLDGGSGADAYTRLTTPIKRVIVTNVP
ncbi:MAG: hypothetical protein NTZ32_18400 [Planctomycetales bacterium]|nr:hypothetical protein [Planctomycetales bacterium]